MDILHIILIIIILILSLALVLTVRRGASKKGTEAKPNASKNIPYANREKGEANSSNAEGEEDENAKPTCDNSSKSLPEYEAVNMEEDFLQNFINSNPTMQHIKNKQSQGKFYFKLRKANAFSSYNQNDKNKNENNIEDE